MTEEQKAKQREYRKKYYQENKKKAKEYYSNNKEKLLKQGKEYYSKNKEKILKQSKEYYSNNKEKILKQVKEYHIKNPYAKKARKHRRRARIKNASGYSTKEQIQARFDYHGNKCYYCGDTSCELQIEHRIPLSRGGSNWPANIVPACRFCNSKKFTKKEHEFKNAS